MTAGKLTGSASISFEQPVYIESAAAIAGKKEGDGPLGNLFDMVSKDPLSSEPRPGRQQKALFKKKPQGLQSEKPD